MFFNLIYDELARSNKENNLVPNPRKRVSICMISWEKNNCWGFSVSGRWKGKRRGRFSRGRILIIVRAVEAIEIWFLYQWKQRNKLNRMETRRDDPPRELVWKTGPISRIALKKKKSKKTLGGGIFKVIGAVEVAESNFAYQPTGKSKLGSMKTKKKIAYDTQYSQPVTHVSTNWARRSLTSEIGRDRVFSTWYGRKR